MTEFGKILALVLFLTFGLWVGRITYLSREKREQEIWDHGFRDGQTNIYLEAQYRGYCKVVMENDEIASFEWKVQDCGEEMDKLRKYAAKLESEKLHYLELLRTNKDL